jgi:hypothetical protein
MSDFIPYPVLGQSLVWSDAGGNTNVLRFSAVLEEDWDQGTTNLDPLCRGLFLHGIIGTSLATVSEAEAVGA